MRFTRSRHGIEAKPDEIEVEVLRGAVTDLVALLGEGAAEDADPLAALVGLPPGEVEPPSDPALARLFPDAYGDDDDEASREFRRYTESDLRAGKRADAAVVLQTLVRPGRMVLDPEQAAAWLGTLNDLRLVLGTRLEVTEDLDLDGLPEGDPRAPSLQVYGWLGWLQESLLSCIEPRTS